MSSAEVLAFTASPISSSAPAHQSATALDIWARFTKQEISLSHALHDIKGKHYGITHYGAKEARQAAAENNYKVLGEIKQQRSDMLVQFLPPEQGSRLFDEIILAMQAEPVFQNTNDIIEIGMMCLSEAQREKAYAHVRDIILTKNNCKQGTPATKADVFGYAAATALINARTKLFPTDTKEDVKQVLNTDLKDILDLSLQRVEALRHDENALTQSGAAIELIANYLGYHGLEDDRLLVSNTPVMCRNSEPVYPVLLKNTFNGVGAGPVVVIGGRVDYLQEFRREARLSSMVPQEAHAFLEKIAYGFVMRNMGRLNGQFPTPEIW